jgi:hypothetical protein
MTTAQRTAPDLVAPDFTAPECIAPNWSAPQLIPPDWTAPRVGYLLTAAIAGRRYAEAAGMWRALDESAQCDVIRALGTQARVAVAEAGVQLEVDFTWLADRRCPEALTAAKSAYAGTGPWEPPDCRRCRELVALALAEIQLKAEVAAGMPASYVDLICQGKAVDGSA